MARPTVAAIAIIANNHQLSVTFNVYMWKCPFIFLQLVSSIGQRATSCRSLFHSISSRIVQRPLSPSPSPSWASLQMANQLTPRIGMCLQAALGLFFFFKHTHSRAWDLCVIKCFTHAPLDYDAWEFISQPKSRIHSFGAIPITTKRNKPFSAQSKYNSLSFSLARLVCPSVRAI